MQFDTALIPSNQLPIRRHLMIVYWLTVVIIVGMAIASIVGLLFQEVIYPTEDLSQAYVANDAVNLIFGVPILIGSVWMARRGHLIGLLFWPGALLYTFYNYIAYLFGIPFGWMTFVNGALVLLSGYVMVDLWRNIDHASVQMQLFEAVPIRFSGWVLIGYGVMFLGIAGNLINQAITDPLAFSTADVGVAIADSVLSLLLIGGGVLLLRRTAFGFTSGAGVLFAATALFVGVMLVLGIRPFFTTIPLDITEIVVLFVMSSICFVAFGLFTRGILSEK